MSLTLPHVGFNRNVGTFAGRSVSPDGKLLTAADFADRVRNWLPTADDRAYVESLMVGVHEQGKIANWVAAPSTGIHAKPVDYDYVKV
jgi:benzoyl-CoA 2,3-epoxidase subunit B